MKVENVLNINKNNDPTNLLDVWIKEYDKYENNKKEFYKDRIKKAYDIYINKKEYDEKEFDGDYPFGREDIVNFANKYLSIEDIVKFELEEYDLIDFKSELLKGFYHEINNEPLFAYRHYIKARDIDNEVFQRGLILRNVVDKDHLVKEIKKGNLKFIKRLEKERITKNIKDFWTVCLETGYIEQKNIKLMHQFQYEWRKLCADAGDPFSMYVISLSLVRGYPFGQDADDAFKYAKQASDLKEYMAYLVLGFLYEGGFGCPKDIHKAIECYEIASNHGVIGAMLRLNLIYSEGKEDVKPNKQKAKEYI